MSAQSHWGWRPRQSEGIWRHGCAWTKPFFAAVPWVTLALLLGLFAFIGDRLPQVPGLMCDLPARVAGQTEATGLAALVLPSADAKGESLVFFDDARYSLSDKISVDTLKDRLSVRAGAEPSRTFLLLADRRVPTGDIMRLVDLARGSGLMRVQIAERRE